LKSAKTDFHFLYCPCKNRAKITKRTSDARSTKIKHRKFKLFILREINLVFKRQAERVSIQWSGALRGSFSLGATFGQVEARENLPKEEEE